MVDAAVSFTIEKLSEFITKQVNIRIGVKDGIEWLKDELGYLLISVRAAEAHQDKDHIRRWTDSVKEVANQAVIILERFSAQQEEQASHQQGGVLDRMRNFICICKKEANLFDIGKDIESLKERVLGIKNRRDEYRINDLIIANPDVQQRKRTLLKAASFDHEKDVIGFEDAVRTLLAQLGNGDSSLGLISIHGMGGLGKSTLASKLYHSSELSHFRSRAWVCVSEDYEITHVLRKIINLFTGQQDSFNDMEEVELVRHLRNILLGGDHYLAVIDDIWDVDVWKRIKNAFPDKKNGSRVIITTRNSMVAEGVDETCFVHKLRFLSEVESWQLFCKRAKPTLNLETLGKEMVGKCGGLPLAIVILSGLLLQKKTYTFWSDVKDHFWKKLKGKSLEIQEVLNLSYNDLSFRTRQCFLFLARFPEDHIIEVFDLKLLWIAEEFISEADEDDGGDMEDVADDIVTELISRNMIQMQLQSADGQVKKCSVHDLVRDLAIEKAMENKILGCFDSSKPHPNPTRLLQGQSRHSIYNGIGEYLKLLKPNPDDLNLRSLALINETDSLKIELVPEIEVKVIYTRFKYLKVLDLRNVKHPKGIPDEIGDLILLKFLGLMGGDSLVIPPSIGKLKKLQTLRGSEYTRYEFPSEICELKEIRHLLFSGIDGNLNIGRDQTKLRTITSISYREWFHMDHVNLINLHTLCITTYDEENGNEYSLESIAKLTSLRALYMELRTGSVFSTIQPLSSCKHLNKVYLTGKIRDPAELSFLPDSVTELILLHTDFTRDPMPTLGTLSNLSGLCMAGYAYAGKMVCSADAFPCLKYLDLGNLYDLEEFQVDDGALPSLKAFQIKLNERVEMDKIPQRIRSLPPVSDLYEYSYY